MGPGIDWDYQVFPPTLRDSSDLPTLTIYSSFGGYLCKAWPSSLRKSIIFSVNLTLLTPSIIVNLHLVVYHFISFSQLCFAIREITTKVIAKNVDKIRMKTETPRALIGRPTNSVTAIDQQTAETLLLRRQIHPAASSCPSVNRFTPHRPHSDIND